MYCFYYSSILFFIFQHYIRNFVSHLFRNKIAKITNYIENIKEWQWLLITFIISLIAMISISIRILWEPYIHAKMGGHFINYAMFVGKKSLFRIRAR